MRGTKTVQKTWAFSPKIIEELEVIRLNEMRSQQNMVEVLIHDAYLRLNGEEHQVTGRDYEAGN